MYMSSPDLFAENEALRREIAAKSDLISVSAHQLRTSLSAMKWILKMFADGDFGELSVEQQSFVEKALENDERMIRLVNEMLSINHAEETMAERHPSPVDLVALMDSTVFDFTGESYKRGVQLIFLKPERAPEPIMADPEKLRVVFQNLIENAIKYSNKGDRVFVSITKKDDAIEISVRDTGIGIAPEDQPKIFGKAFRAENAKKQDSVGSGLGLYTTKRIIEKEGGQIWFQSAPGEGTTFFVRLPAAPGAPLANAPAA